MNVIVAPRRGLQMGSRGGGGLVRSRPPSSTWPQGHRRGKCSTLRRAGTGCGSGDPWRRPGRSCVDHRAMTNTPRVARLVGTPASPVRALDASMRFGSTCRGDPRPADQGPRSQHVSLVSRVQRSNQHSSLCQGGASSCRPGRQHMSSPPRTRRPPRGLSVGAIQTDHTARSLIVPVVDLLAPGTNLFNAHGSEWTGRRTSFGVADRGGGRRAHGAAHPGITPPASSPIAARRGCITAPHRLAWSVSTSRVARLDPSAPRHHDARRGRRVRRRDLPRAMSGAPSPVRFCTGRPPRATATVGARDCGIFSFRVAQFYARHESSDSTALVDSAQPRRGTATVRGHRRGIFSTATRSSTDRPVRSF